MREVTFALLLAIAGAAVDPRTLRLTLDPRGSAGVGHVARTAHIEFDVTLHHSESARDVERPEADFENHDPRYFDHRPGPNVVLTVVRVDGSRRTPVPFRTIYFGGGGTVDTDSQSIAIIIPPADKVARLAKMVDCVAAAMPQRPDARQLAAGTATYVERGIVDNEPGMYEVTASYRATTWGKATASIVSPPLKVTVDDGIDGYQHFCDALKAAPKAP
jgi:hypothetical protein